MNYLEKLLIFSKYAGAAEQVKQVKQLLHRNSEVLLEKFLASWMYERGIFRASPEKSSFRRPWRSSIRIVFIIILLLMKSKFIQLRE